MKSHKDGNKVNGESIKFRCELDLDGYEDLRQTAQKAGLVGP